MRLGGVCRDNGRILLANLFQGSRSTFSCVSFPSVFCLPSRHVGHIHFDTFEFANSIRAFFVHADF